MQKEEVWSKVGHTDKAQQILGNELIRALDAPLATHLTDEGGKDQNGKAQSAQALKDRYSLQADLTGETSSDIILSTADAGPMAASAAVCCVDLKGLCPKQILCLLSRTCITDQSGSRCALFAAHTYC